MIPGKDLDITFSKKDSKQLKPKPDENQLGFGVHFTDHMFAMNWDRQRGWHEAEICPYHDFPMDPAAMVFHYGQAIFEGLKAYRGKDDQIFLFRPKDNFERMNKSAIRMCMPRVPVDTMIKALKALVYLDREWVPRTDGATLYLRPTMIATEAGLGIRPADKYSFFVITTPVGAYYAEGFNPVKIYVSDKYVRAVVGGTGEAKTAGNYASSIMALTEAQKKGYTQVLWLDAKDRKNIEEVGTSNIFFQINDELITPPLGGTILPGITRDSVLQLAQDWEIPTVERQISIDEVIQASKDGSLKDAFATGTAAVISPIGELCYKDEIITINNGQTGELANRLFEELQAIQFGNQVDPHKWIERVG